MIDLHPIGLAVPEDRMDELDAYELPAESESEMDEGGAAEAIDRQIADALFTA